MTPRPILKHFPPHSLSLGPESSVDSSSYPDLFTPYSGALPFSSSRNISPLESPHVHFPPTPILTKMGTTHSSYSYDRHPIEVLPNSLALPQRGARDIDEPMSGSEMWTTNFDNGYFSLDEHVHATTDVELSGSSSNRKLILFESETNATNAFPVQMVPFENIQNHFNDVYSHITQPSLARDPSTESSSEPYGSLPSNELSASISISIHFSRLSNQSYASPPNLTRKRDPDDYDSENRRKTRARRKHSLTKPKKYCQEEDMYTELDEDTNSLSKASSIGTRYDLGLGRVLNRTKNSMDAIINDSSSSNSVCGTHFTSFCDPGLEGCLGGF